MLPCSNGSDLESEAVKLGEALASVSDRFRALEAILGALGERLAGIQRVAVALSDRAEAEAAELGRS